MSEKKQKRLNTNSNTYIIVYAAILVVVVAFLLAFVSSSLKPTQDENVALDKQKQILAALNIRNLSDKDSKAAYEKAVLQDMVINQQNEVLQQGGKGGVEAGFKLTSQDFKAGKLALYVCQVDGKIKYVIPVYGMGLWGPISGYIALNDDKNTVYGAYFNHESETAGLGAEIKDNEKWQEQFQGKQVRAQGKQDIALEVRKKTEVKDPATQCDAVTGATLTSDGVSLMLKTCLKEYTAFFNEKQ